MDSFLNQDNKPTTDHRKHHPNQSNSDLLSDAKLMAEAARYTFSHETDKVDKGKVAGAAEDLLNAASTYGHLDQKGFGKYVDKAEEYLHQYHSSQSTTGPGHHSATNTTTTTHSSTHSGGGNQIGGGEYGDYIKMAEGFFKKH